MGYELQENLSKRAQIQYTALQNTIEAVKLRSRGYPIAEIASQLGVTPNTVSSYLKEALKRIVGQDVEELRGLEAARLDQLQGGLWDKAIAGDYRAIDRVLAISKRRAELLGIDKKFDKADIEDGPKQIVIEAYRPEPAEDGIISPSGESLAIDSPSDSAGGGDGIG